MKIKKGILLIDQHDKNGFWGGKFGGNFIPETLKKPVEDLTILFEKLRRDKKFIKERDYYFKNWVGSPTPFVKLEKLTKHLGGAQIWAKVVSEEFRAKNERSMMMRFHTQTGGSTLTAQQPHNNVVRTAVQALSAVLGGTQSLHTNALDEALGLPSEKAARVALRTQQIIAEESGITNTIDPLAGSYTIEAMTQELVDGAMALINEIDSKGGMLACIEEGWVQLQIMDSAYRYQKEVEQKERTIVGVNEYVDGEEFEPEEVTKIDGKAIQNQIQRLEKLRKERGDISKHLEILEEKASTEDENLMPYIIDAVNAKVTIGEICNAFRKVWGEYRPTETL